MTRLDNDDDPLGVKSRLQTLANLRGGPFLQVQTTGKGFDKPGERAEAGYTTVGHIADMGLAEEWQYMVFAERVELDVFDHDYLTTRTVLFFEKGRFDDFLGRLAVARGEGQHGLGRAHGSFYKAFAGRIFSQEFKYGFVMGGQAV